ncbi:tRNA (adenosine(37)-N6)-dimethylallyltransferase MiaA [Cellulophaga sp. HaHa_2_95]|uniref:tRNA (adenosine(37)-N6)-dimethylallyltransferase MiaA n=1 Tax=unclassified Cellulophaga TaxID=2634405 RepID=UPI001C4E52FB|nr:MULTISPECIES: tRNA (adenosine(37)-N6)-dimethylallyltransferase MiaA [unclassified Cellulophaga]QXP53435.1 tRNA (adenosine(37)-N6)-dimethylallyltransferase MiaA [Cellulophaga sp. HaHa_2_1]QXP57957.1 tRNA (adenosine(37)-N6)-dimethylallyltransferase MiaA [Cellulophaga sp. HaHa_2_95]
MEKTVISVVGPTAIGKTKLAIAIAQQYNTEIISADSRQFFKEMNIGTAVPSSEELAAAPHHFVQHKSILEPYSVGDFERDAIATLETLFETKDIVVLVGGSGLYVDAVTKGLDHFPEVDSAIRTKLNQQLTTQGIAALQNQLKELDPDYFNKVDIQNPHRLVRALEICIGTGKPYSSFLNKDKNKRPFKTITLGIEAEREMIYERINQRVDLMVDAGLIDEVKSLIENKALNALQTVGYKELFNYFEGLWPLDFAISEIKKNTRRFAKRQLTWFRRTTETIWVGFDEEINVVIDKIETKIK